MSTKDVLSKVADHVKVTASVRASVEEALKEAKAKHTCVNARIQANNSAKNSAENAVKVCIANLHSKGLSKEAFPALDAARAELDKVSRDDETDKLIKESETLEYEVSDLKDALTRVS